MVSPRERTAVVTVLHEGYVRPEGEVLRVGSTVGLVRDGDLVLVVDPGMVADRQQLLEALRAAGTDPAEVTDVVLSHHHPDHTVNVALFPRARVHDHAAVYEGDVWTRRDADGVELSPSVLLVRTPGHTEEDISTLVGTADGVLAFTHAWWSEAGPLDDPYAPDPAMLAASRRLLLGAADTLVPGHGPAFSVTAAPR